MSLLPLSELKWPRIAFGGRQWHTRRSERDLRVRAEAVPSGENRKVGQKLGAALLSATVALSVGLAAAQPPPALAEDAQERRQIELQRRKELLAKTREKALAGGGVESGNESAAASSPSTEEDPEVKQANAEVERSNKEREREAERMRQSLKSSLQNYDAASKQDENKLKPGSDAPENLGWFSQFLEKNAQINPRGEEPPEGKEASSALKAAQLDQGTATPKEPSKPAFSFNKQRPEEDNQKPQTVNPVPAEPPKEKPKGTSPFALKQPDAAEEGEKGTVSKPPESPFAGFSFKNLAQPQKATQSPLEEVPAKSAPLGLEKQPDAGGKVDDGMASKSAESPFSGFSFRNIMQPQKAGPVPAEDKPETVSPAPRPAAPKPGVQPVQPMKKEQKTESKKGKRRGPLPAAVAQLLLLAIFGGLGYTFLYKEEEANKVLAVFARAISGTYTSLEGVFKRKKKGASPESS